MNSSTTTLRTLLEARRGEGRRFSLAEAVATIVPLCLDLQGRHGRGERVYVHPSCVAPGPDGLPRLEPTLAVLPTVPRDVVCLAPELQSTLAPGDAKASVVLTPEQQTEVDNFRRKAVETRRELKNVRKALRADTESLEFWTKVVNIGLMPLVITIAGIAFAIGRRRV